MLYTLVIFDDETWADLEPSSILTWAWPVKNGESSVLTKPEASFYLYRQNWRSSPVKIDMDEAQQGLLSPLTPQARSLVCGFAR